MSGVPKTIAELASRVDELERELAQRIVELERRQAMMLRRIAGDADAAARLDGGGEWDDAVAWARRTYPMNGE